MFGKNRFFQFSNTKEMNMIEPNSNLPNVSSLLLVIHQLLLSSNENTLLLLFDKVSSDLATEIFRLNVSQAKVVQTINSDIYNINERIFYENTIIISIISRPIAHVGEDYLRVYYHEKLNRKSKHLCLISSQSSSSNNHSDIEEFSKFFIKHNIHVVPVVHHWNDSNFVIHSFELAVRKTLRNLYPNDVLNKSENVRELIFPSFNVRDIDVTYYAINFNPPYLYRVEDFTSESQTYLGGIEIRMMELLIDQLNWTVHFETFDQFLKLTNDDSWRIETYQRINKRIFRTNVPTKRRHKFFDHQPNTTSVT